MNHVLLVSGLDPSGGAGLIADTRAVEILGARPAGVVTALTVQDTRGVRSVHPVSAEVLGEQLAAVLGDIELAAVKVGMLGSEEIARTVAEALSQTAAPVVWDPVGAPTAGAAALYAGDLRAAGELLSSHLTVVTPNLAEATALCGIEIATVEEQSRAAKAVSEALGCAAIVTGGHLPHDADSFADVLAEDGECIAIPAPRIDAGGPVHGTGCAYSTAVACALAVGASVQEAAVLAGRFVRARLADPVRAGRGHRSVL